MRVIHFERDKEGLHLHGGSYVQGFYIPDKKLILFSERQGTFGEDICSFTDNPALLDELQPLLQGEIPTTDGVTYSRIKEFEYDEERLSELIQDAQTEKELRAKLKSGIEALLSQANTSNP